ncbi:MAG: phosphoglycerate dehydrogenase [bacterium]|nr:phosphoglycerate dehydrogenase [bacterium]MCX7916814.1 phosphoglycerate dehydrogenase [bacterium]MDW8163119.1 phosphoglycerate dehydrogenase [Candidatus Omnitrophota bacterium]
MEKIKILITEPFEKEGKDILIKEGFEVQEVGKISTEELVNIIPSYDVLIVRSATKVTKDVIEKGGKLKIIGRAGVGLDNIDIQSATENGVIVMNAPEGNTISAAEHTIGLIFALARNIPNANQTLKNGKWEKKKFLGTELYGKTIGIVGVGRIGRRVATLAKNIGMKVIAYDPYVNEEEIREMGITLVNFEGLLKQSDIITFHLPLTEETYHLISDKEFEIMKDGVMIINCARGGIIDEEALVRYLKKGKVKGAALDVFEKEPIEQSPLFEFENVIVTPHLGASTKEAQVNVAIQLSTQIVEALKKKIVKNAVNFPTLDEKTYEKLRGYLSLGEKMGLFLRQMLDGDLKSIEITYSGEITNYDLTLLRANILIGLLKSEKKINPINVLLIIKEKGIKLTEKRERKPEEFTNLITVEVKNDRTVSLSGTLVRDEGRIVKIDGFSVEAVPEGILLVCYNEDKPGIMGHIGTILGQKGINIASMTLGRKKKGGPAITVLNLDQEVDKEVLLKIKEFPAIKSVRLVRI